ncbi:MAG: universal stress protein [Hydrogenophilaceae bacterium]|nr:universal stress protein [Hydrogenophilaceae bacterium]
MITPSRAPEAAARRVPGQKTKPGVALLVLDGKRLEKAVLPSAVQICRQGGHRLDILMASPPKEPLHLLGKFLQLLESAGIDYRLSSVEGGLVEETLRYVQKHRQITMVLIGSNQKPSRELDAASQQLREMGYPVGVLVA